MTIPTEPGSFWQSDQPVIDEDPYQPGGDSYQPDSPHPITEANIESPDSSLGQAVGECTQRFGMPASVIYPGCGFHVIDRLFPSAKVVYVDPTQHGIDLIRAAIGDQSRAMASFIEPVAVEQAEQFDWLFSLNSHAPMDAQLRCVKPGGFVFCNNYMGTTDAEAVIAQGDTTLRAVYLYGEGEASKLQLLAEGLEPYLEVDTSLPPGHLGCRLKRQAVYYVFSKNEVKD